MEKGIGGAVVMWFRHLMLSIPDQVFYPCIGIIMFVLAVALINESIMNASKDGTWPRQ